MAETLSRPAPHRVSTQRLAWGVMLLSFAIFCAILIFIILGANYFIFQSRVPLQSIIQVARGTATSVDRNLNETPVQGQREIERDSLVTTDPQTQASLVFNDPQQDDRLLASVTLKNGSSLRLNDDSRPRFEWSDREYWIDFEDAAGEFDIFIPQGLDRPILITFSTTLGPAARLSASGRYTLSALGSQVSLVNYSGEALLLTGTDNRYGQSVPVGQRASIPADASSDQFSVTPGYVNLLGDTTFSARNVIDFNASPDQTQAQVWRCTSLQEGQPPGSYGLTMEDGRPVLRLFRDGGATSHGETRCFQSFGNGLDISNFSSVSIRATFKIASQSLTVCGTNASECPFTLEMDYYPPPPTSPDQALQAKAAHHGFYALSDPNRTSRLKCDTCWEDHEYVNSGVWYTYESQNIFDIFQLDQRPQSILNIRFYASGHEYDVYVSEMALLVNQSEIPLMSAGG